ncbi:putative disease resistance protein RGA1 [Senna tora]|uniref:Putative disease resistance protein RGA1 n=1 Tax=Senna tora TaxID=362788 RepID=A0A834SXS6_9FABA|nr:putative disease resistance protein RGA1 [Senna tora]
MAEAILEILLENLNSFARSELATFCGVNGEIKRLTKSLKLIQAVVEDAEQKEITSKPTRIWLQELKDAAHVLDDILDEYSIRSPPHNSRSASQPHCFSLSSIKPNNIWFCYRIGKRLKEISQRLDQISEDRNRHHFVQREVVVIREGPIQVPEWRHTGFVIQSKKVYGRDGDKRKIVELLIKHDHDGLFVYPIAGLGGLGKTTLAQLVFNDPEVINHFNSFRIWICISDDFSVIRILQSIMESLTSQKCDTSNLATLQKNVQGKLRNVRYLLVLDDVWNQDQDRWYQLRSVLECGSKGASVLVTTLTTDDDGCMRFKMHDLVHDLAQSVTEKECSIMKDGDITNLPRSTHHIGFWEVSDTLFSQGIIHKVTHATVIMLSNTLECLRHLIILRCPAISCMPPSIGKLSGLRTLSLFIVRSKEEHSLKELHGLNLCQRELSIKGLECVGNVDEAKGVNLIGIRELQVLSLSWGNSEESEIKAVRVDAEQVIEALQPFSNLKKFEVYGYKGSHFPNWMKDASCLNNLVSLSLKDCSNCVQLPALGKLPSLENLYIVNVACVEYMDDDECYDGVEVKAFISLKTLSLYNMPKLERLLKRELGGEMFPRLHKLYISKCPQLTLSCLPSVEELNILYCQEELIKSISSLCGLKSLRISRCSKLKELPTQFKSLHALEKLVLFSCDELECIPEQVLEALNSLRTLYISDCRALKCLPESIQHLTSLEFLSINRCSILEERCKEGSGEDWYKIQHIPNIKMV